MLLWLFVALSFVSGGLDSRVAAQELDPCFGLSAADCLLIETASANLLTNTRAFAYDFTFDLSVTGLKHYNLGEDLNTYAEGSGAFRLTSTNASIPFDLALDLTVSSPDASDDPNSTRINFVILEGDFYLQDPEGSGFWISLPLDELLTEKYLRQLGIPVSPATLAALFSGGGARTLQNLGGFSADDTAEMLALPGFMAYERLPDEMMNDLVVYPFSFTTDFGVLFTSEPFGRLLDRAFDIAERMERMNQDAQQAQLLAPLILKSSTVRLNITQWVGADDEYVHKLNFHLFAALDFGKMVAEATGQQAPDVPPLTLDMTFTLDLQDINTSVAITPPAEFIEITPADLGLTP